MGRSAGGDAVAEDLIFLRIAGEAQAAFVGDGGGGFEQNERLVGVEWVGAAGGGVAGEGGGILLGAPAAQGGVVGGVCGFFSLGKAPGGAGVVEESHSAAAAG